MSSKRTTSNRLQLGCRITADGSAGRGCTLDVSDSAAAHRVAEGNQNQQTNQTKPNQTTKRDGNSVRIAATPTGCSWSLRIDNLAQLEHFRPFPASIPRINQTNQKNSTTSLSLVTDRPASGSEVPFSFDLERMFPSSSAQLSRLVMKRWRSVSWNTFHRGIVFKADHFNEIDARFFRDWTVQMLTSEGGIQSFGSRMALRDHFYF